MQRICAQVESVPRLAAHPGRRPDRQARPHADEETEHESFGPCPAVASPSSNGQGVPMLHNRRETIRRHWKTTEDAAGAPGRPSQARPSPTPPCRLLAGRKVGLKGFTSRKGGSSTPRSASTRQKLAFDFGDGRKEKEMTETQQTMTEFTYATGRPASSGTGFSPVRGPVLAQDKHRHPKQHARDVQARNTLLGVIPLGSSTRTIPLRNIASVDTNTKFNPGSSVWGGVFSSRASRSCRTARRSGSVPPARGSEPANTMSAQLDFVNGVGGRNSVKVSILEKDKLMHPSRKSSSSSSPTWRDSATRRAWTHGAEAVHGPGQQRADPARQMSTGSARPTPIRRRPDRVTRRGQAIASGRGRHRSGF